MLSACTRRLLFALTLALGLWNASAHACKCRPLSVDEAKADASAIFEGRVTKLADEAPAEGRPPAGKLVTLALVRTWKGLENEETITVRTSESSASCGYAFELNKSYLVYAQGTPDALSVSSCSRTRPMAETNEDLAALGAGITPVKVEPVADAGKPAEPPKTKSGGCASSSTQKRASLAWLGLPVLALAARRRMQRAR
jgi:MYXO-CTERM domain-containing protein